MSEMIFKERNLCMNEVTRRISLDLSRDNNVHISFASQYDLKSRVILITILDDGAPYKIDKVTSIVVNVLRPDGKSMGYAGYLTEDGLIKYTLGSWALSVVGTTIFSVSFYDADKRKLTTSPFTIDVAPSIYVGTNVSSVEDAQSAFDNMMSELSGVKAAEELRVAAEYARENNELSRSRSETVRRLEEETRSQNEETRIANESLRCQVTNNMIIAINNLLEIQQQYISSEETDE